MDVCVVVQGVGEGEEVISCVENCHPILEVLMMGWSWGRCRFFEQVSIAGGEATTSTIGYIAKGKGIDCQMFDTWCIWFQSLTVFVQGHFVFIDYLLGLQYNVVVRCIRRCRCRLSNRLGQSGMKEHCICFVIPSWCWNWWLYTSKHSQGLWWYNESIHKVLEVHRQGLGWLLVTLSMVYGIVQTMDIEYKGTCDLQSNQQWSLVPPLTWFPVQNGIPNLFVMMIHQNHVLMAVTWLLSGFRYFDRCQLFICFTPELCSEWIPDKDAVNRMGETVLVQVRWLRYDQGYHQWPLLVMTELWGSKY